MPRHHADRVKRAAADGRAARHPLGFTLPLASHTLGEVVESAKPGLRLVGPQQRSELVLSRHQEGLLQSAPRAG